MTMSKGRETALMAVAVATRERLDEAILRVYLEDERVAGFSDEDFAAACKALMVADWFPKLGELVRACANARHERLARLDKERRSRLALAEHYEPPDPDAARRILERLYSATGKHIPEWLKR